MEKKEQKQTEKEKTGLAKMFMKDRKGVPLNPAIKAKNPQKYGVMAQH